MKKICILMVICISVSMLAGMNVLAYNTHNLTRRECITSLFSDFEIDYENADISVLENFSDYDSEDWAKEQVAAAVEYGIINGYEDNTLRLDNEVTRAEFCCMIYRARNYFDEREKLTEYNGAYTDIADWHRAETIYCVERGFMLGYGDRFGSADPITNKQEDIIAERLKYGLSTRDRYMHLFISGADTIDMNTVLASAYYDEINAYVPGNFDENSPGMQKENYIHSYYDANQHGFVSVDDPSYVKGQAAQMFYKKLDLIGNMDVNKLADEEYKQMVTDNFYSSGFQGTPLAWDINTEGNKTNIDNIIADAKQNGTVRESIHVFAPENTYCTVFPTAFSQDYTCGYEYFRYTAGQNLPEGIEVNKWYRRKATATHIEQVVRAYYYPLELICVYGEPEQVFVNEDILKLTDSKGETIITNNSIVSAEYLKDENRQEWVVMLTLTDQGREKFSRATKRISAYADGENYIAVYLKDVLISAPRVSDEIVTSTVLITGDFTEESAKSFVDELNKAIK